jgi:hypothetical protein
MKASQSIIQSEDQLMKAIVGKASVAAILLLLVSWVAAQSRADRPLNVPAENWIAISATAGVVILNVNSTPSRTIYRFENEPRNVPLLSAASVLVVKYNGIWTRVDLAAPPAQGQPLGL